MSWLWIGGLGLFAIVGVSLFIALQRGEVIWDLLKSIASDIYNALKPAILKRKTPAEEAAWRQAGREGREWDPIKDKPREPR